jgi:hypothetical protein
MSEIIKTLRNSFTNKAFTYPLKSDSNENYYKTLQKNYLLFQQKIEELPEAIDELRAIKDRSQEIESLSIGILNSIGNYLWGSRKFALEYFSEFIEQPIIKSNLLRLSTAINTDENKETFLFRIRESDNELTERSEMFHIPFDARHLVENQRFSISGLPCLYLGSSIYVCWLELGKPKLSNIYISGFKVNNSVKTLDLAYDLELILTLLEEGKLEFSEFTDRLVLFPLIMACSFRTKHLNAAFHEEYIIPGLLLEWIAYESKQITGLKYLSTKLNTTKNEYGINYVFPPRNFSAGNKYCPELTENFQLTNPLSWDILSILPQINVVMLGTGLKAENLEDALIESYKYSKFGFVEEQVLSMNFDKIC